ncbi:putative glycoside hydrolase [Elusimicrobiota bacterium]
MNTAKKIILLLFLVAFIIFWGWTLVSSLSFFGLTFRSEKGKIEKPKTVFTKPKYVRGIHITGWVAGSEKLRSGINKMLQETELNTVVIAIKEYDGEVRISGFKNAKKYGSSVNVIPDLKEYLEYLNESGVYTIARIVVFKDNLMAKVKPEWLVKNSSGDAWEDYAGNKWIDPFNKKSWEYNIDIAVRAVELGFQEIQFDYTRFPSDGEVSKCVYSEIKSSTTASGAMVGFLKEANNRLKPLGVKVSVDVFGLTTTTDGDLGIGQDIVLMGANADYVSPMVYPSHYYPGEFGIENPDASPYETVYMAIKGATQRLPISKIRPYLQSFSLGHIYGVKEIREQIQACYDNDVPEWILWNSRSVYKRDALKSNTKSGVYGRSDRIAEMEKRNSKEEVVEEMTDEAGT